MSVEDEKQEEIDEEAEAIAEEKAFEEGFSGEDSEESSVASDEADGASDDTEGADDQAEDPGDAEKEAAGEKDSEKAAADGDDGSEDKAGAVEPELDPTEVRLRRLEGRYGSLSRDVKATTEQVATLAESGATKQVQAEGSEAPTTAQIKDAKVSTEKYEALKEEFPEWTDAMDEQRASIEASLRNQMVSADDVSRLVREAIQADRTEAAELEAEQSLKEMDWEEKVADPRFKKWIETQDEATVALAASDSWVDAHTLVAMYSKQAYNEKHEPDESQAEIESRLAGAISPTKGGARKSLDREPTDEDDFIAGFEGR